MLLHLSNRIALSMDSVDTMVIDNPVPSRVAWLKTVGCFVERARHNLSRYAVNDHTPHVGTVAA
jgi:hypothetical protein